MKTPSISAIACFACLGLGWAVGRLGSGEPASVNDSASSAKGASLSTGADSIDAGAGGSSAADAAARDWLRSDKTAATNWLKTTNSLSAESKTKLLPK